jgi:hypothetical protein
MSRTNRNSERSIDTNKFIHMKKKIYISLPITGKDIDLVKRDASWNKIVVKNQGWDAITPFDVCGVKDRRYSFYMGKDIEVLLECDAIYMCKGWQDSKGCMAEFEVARIYGKEIIFE